MKLCSSAAVLSEFDAELQRASAAGASDFISTKEKELLDLLFLANLIDG